MADQRSTPTRIEVFVQGALLRLQAGLAGFGIIALCAPRIIIDHHQNLIWATALFSLICIAGGIKDANTPSIEDRRLFRRITLKQSLINAASLLAFAYAVIKMK